MNKFSIISLVAASLLSACASAPSHSQAKTASSDCCASEKAPHQAQRDYAAKTAASVPSAAPSGKHSKAHVRDSTQVETVLGTKPVIGDDSELRR